MLLSVNLFLLFFLVGVCVPCKLRPVRRDCVNRISFAPRLSESCIESVYLFALCDLLCLLLPSPFPCSFRVRALLALCKATTCVCVCVCMRGLSYSLLQQGLTVNAWAARCPRQASLSPVPRRIGDAASAAICVMKTPCGSAPLARAHRVGSVAAPASISV